MPSTIQINFPTSDGHKNNAEKRQHHPIPIPDEEGCRGQAIKLMVPPGCEGCQLALWVRCRRRRLVYIRCAIPLFSFFVHNHAPLSARYQMIKSSAACLPLDARLLLACCVRVSVCVCIHNSSATETTHPSGTTYSYITKGYRLLARCVCFSAQLFFFFVLSGQLLLRLRLRLQLRLEGDTVAHIQWPKRRQ